MNSYIQGLPLLALGLIFAGAAAAVWWAGVRLSTTTEVLDRRMGMSHAIGGALLLATSIPSLSTGYQATRLGQYQLVVTKEFSSNAFLVALLFLAGTVAGTTVISSIGTAGILFGSMGVVLGGVYAIGLLVRDDHVILRAGIGSLIVLVLYIAGLVALVVLV